MENITFEQALEMMRKQTQFNECMFEYGRTFFEDYSKDCDSRLPNTKDLTHESIEDSSSGNLYVKFWLNHVSTF